MKKIIFFIFLNSYFYFLFGQTGTLKVIVYDKGTNETLVGSTVVISGTTQGSITNLDGEAIIILSQGKYDIEVSFIGYKKAFIKNVEIIADEIKIIKIGIAEEAVVLDKTVVVTGQAITNRESALLTVQRKHTQLVNAISSEEFSRNGDNNAAAALRRVTGVTIENNKYICVRGLGDRYSKSILNGADLPGLDPDRNAVQLDLFPSNLIDNITVHKTFSPDLTGEFTGGLVNIITKEFPDNFTMQASTSLGYNDQATFNRRFITHKGSNTEWIGFDNTRALPSKVIEISQKNPNFIDNQDIVDITHAFSTPQFQANQKSPFFNRSLNISLGDKLNLFKKELGFIWGFSYNRNHNFYENGEFLEIERAKLSDPNLKNLQGSIQTNLNDSRSEENTTLGTLLNTTLRFNNSHKLRVNLMHNQSANKNTRFLQGQWNKLGPLNPYNIFESHVANFLERGVSTIQVKGENRIGKNDKFHINWFSSYASSYLDEPDLRFLSSNFQVNKNDIQDTVFIISNLNNPGRYYRDMNEQISDNRINIISLFSLIKNYQTKLKAGLAYTLKKRNFSEKRYEYRLDEISYEGNVDDIFLTENLAYIDGKNRLSGTYIVDRSRNTNTYDANQNIYAAYTMIETPLSDKFKLTTGLRFERNEMIIHFISDKGKPSTSKLENNDILPAFNLIYKWNKKTDIRFAYGRTLARPTFREFAPVRTFNFYGGPSQLGNPNLNRSLIHNLDIRAEIYPHPGEYISFGLFYKNFSNTIVNTQNPGAGGNAIERKYENVDDGVTLGFEVEVRKNLDFISPLLDHFKIGFNTSLIHSAVSLEEEELEYLRFSNPDQGKTRPMFNQSPFIVNANLIYDNPDNKFLVNIIFNVFGERLKLIETALLIYEQPRPDLSFSIKKQIGKHFNIRCRLNNLFNPDYKQTFTFKDQDYIYRNYTRGRTYSLGITYLLE